MQSALQLAEVSVGDVGAFSEVAQRQLGGHPLCAQERTERRELVLGRCVSHADIFPLERARGHRGDSGAGAPRNQGVVPGQRVVPSPEPVDGWRRTVRQAITVAAATVASAMYGNSL